MIKILQDADSQQKGWEKMVIKKNTAIVISLMLIATLATSLGEGITFSPILRTDENLNLRNGIVFGITPSEVQAVEIANGNNLEPEIGEYYQVSGSTTITYEDEGKKFKIAEVPASWIEYYFIDNQFKEVAYHIGDNEIPAPKGTYDKMKEDLIKTYGEPTVSIEGKLRADMAASGKILPIMSFGLYEDCTGMESLSALLGRDFAIDKLCQWLIKYRDCCLVVDLYTSNFMAPDNQIRINYSVIPVNAID